MIESDAVLYGGEGQPFSLAMDTFRGKFKLGHTARLMGQVVEYGGKRLMQVAGFSFQIDMVSYVQSKARPVSLARGRHS